ncbi:MAG: DUF362 domain-containing protein [Methanospirillum sp.]|nr:DUF362 domain-containing protein [Methanospirillum sp.]
MTRRVSIARCRDYDPERVMAAFLEVLAPLGGISAFIRPGDRVLVKPNLLTSRSPGEAVTTHPSVVRAALIAVRDAGGEPVLGDSPGGRNTPENYRSLLRRTGLLPVLEECGVDAVFFDGDTTEIASPAGRVYRRFHVSSAVARADAIVSISKLKTHQLTLATGAVKNCYGYIPGIEKAGYHLRTGPDRRRFADLLLDLYEARPPVLSVMDAVVGMEGNGPSNGTPREVGLLLASPSAPDLDFVEAYLMGFDPLEVPTVSEAARRGLGPRALDEIEVLGLSIEEVRPQAFRRPASHLFARVPAPLVSALNRFVLARPRILVDRCRRCGICSENCPPGAIELVKGAPRIRQEACIRCYCCQELCPADAIVIDRPLLRRLVEMSGAA